MLKDTQTQFSLSRCWGKCIKVMSNASEMLNQSPIKKFDTLQNGIVYMHFGSSYRCCIVLMLSNIFRCKCSDTKRNKSYECEKNDNKINHYNLLNASFIFCDSLIYSQFSILPIHFCDRPIVKLLTTFAASVAIVVSGVTNCLANFAMKLLITIHFSLSEFTD